MEMHRGLHRTIACVVVCVDVRVFFHGTESIVSKRSVKAPSHESARENVARRGLAGNSQGKARKGTKTLEPSAYTVVTQRAKFAQSNMPTVTFPSGLFGRTHVHGNALMENGCVSLVRPLDQCSTKSV